MTYTLGRLAAVLLTCGLAAAGGCWGGAPSRVVPPKIDASAAGADALSTLDTNKDGKLAGKELDAAPGLKAALEKVDKSGDKSIAADEIAARINVWIESKVGRLPQPCSVQRKNKPLAGAKVKFVPEPFLGSAMPTCEGTTDESGTVQPTAPLDPNDPVPGVPPGFYRVEITKSGDKIPEKYNTKTILGVEVAQDSAAQQEGVVIFKLDY
jgi:hypothetical protein